MLLEMRERLLQRGKYQWLQGHGVRLGARTDSTGRLIGGRAAGWLRGEEVETRGGAREGQGRGRQVSGVCCGKLDGVHGN